MGEGIQQCLCAKLQPDILVRGRDYEITQIVGGAEVLANDGLVKVLNFEDGCSTSNIINTIKKHS